MNETLSVAAVALSTKEILLRLLFAMLIGGIVGGERELTHRPAGLRTHMLVALGACTVMITGQMIFCQYFPLGATPDPARLAAQVIAGVGFLGAGTILREGTSIKGLTTAASIWTVACLGVSVGAGFYFIGLAGTILMMITLVIFERIQTWFISRRDVTHEFSVIVSDTSAVMKQINALASQADGALNFIRMETCEEGTSLQFAIKFSRRHYQSRVQEFFAALDNCSDIISIKTNLNLH